ncbi:MAG: isoprenylcysteine carboxylmethyltransferase family protein [Planctomycetia bacterium]|nr:isoprenylcysteine carboxylmethyltransferase family protein [Planctomycetia bacterium]
MNSLQRRAWGGFLFLFVVLALLLFLPVWSIDYWQAWVYLAVFFVSTGAITVYLLKNDTALLQRRMRVGSAAEHEKTQKVIQNFARIAFLAVYLVPAFDHRYAWSSVPTFAVIAGDALVFTGLLIIFLVFKENSFASATVELGQDQTVVSTGPYALVRHPMYSGGLLMLAGTPLALGSWLGLLTLIPMTFAIVWRLLEEERFLAKSLPGYVEYCAKVRSRLIPRFL